MYLEGRLDFLDPKLYAKLREKIDRVPPEEWAALDPEEFPPVAHLSVEEFLSLATRAMWALACSMVKGPRVNEPLRT